MVGHGVDPADAPAYAAHNDLGTAVLLAAMHAAGVRRLVLAGSMVVYGEGRYDCPEHGVVRPGARAPADLDAGRFEPRCPGCGRDLVSGLVGEDAPLDPRSTYAATKAAQEYLVGRVGAADGRNCLVAALPQRLRAADAARHAVRRRRVDLPLRARTGRGAPGAGGRPPAARLRARHRRRRGQRARPGHGPARARAHGRQRLLGGAAHDRRPGGHPRRGDRGTGPAGRRRHPARRRPARRRRSRAGPGAAGLPGRGRLHRRGARVRHGPAARSRTGAGRTAPIAERPRTSPNGKRLGPSSRRAGPEDQDVDTDPEIILPCLDEADALPAVLAGLPPGWPVLVVDNGSTDATADVARALGARVVAEPRRGYGAAVHAGLEAAQREFVAVLDGDGSLDAGVLPALAAAVAGGTADLAVGRRVPQGRRGLAVARPGRQCPDRGAAAPPRGAGARRRADPGRPPRGPARPGSRGPGVRLPAGTAAAGRGGRLADRRVPGGLPGRAPVAGRRFRARCAAPSGQAATWPGCCGDGASSAASRSGRGARAHARPTRPRQGPGGRAGQDPAVPAPDPRPGRRPGRGGAAGHPRRGARGARRPARRRADRAPGRAARAGELAAALRGVPTPAQHGPDLGHRIAAAHRDTAALLPGRPVLQLGMDTPQVDPDLLAEAAAPLRHGAVDAVVGPAADGGWWALGLRDPRAAAADRRRADLSGRHRGADGRGAARGGAAGRAAARAHRRRHGRGRRGRRPRGARDALRRRRRGTARRRGPERHFAGVRTDSRVERGP